MFRVGMGNVRDVTGHEPPFADGLFEGPTRRQRDFVHGGWGNGVDAGVSRQETIGSLVCHFSSSDRDKAPYIGWNRSASLDVGNKRPPEAFIV